MEKIEVGQIVFILLDNDQKLIPVMIVEENIRRQMGVETRKYFAVKKPNDTPFEIKNFKELFLDIDSAREYMEKRVAEAVDHICNDARKNAGTLNNFYRKSNSTQASEPLQALVEEIDEINEDVISVELPNGARAKVKMPTNIHQV